MGLASWFTDHLFDTDLQREAQINQIVEAKVQALMAPENVPDRAGFVFGVPAVGTGGGVQIATRQSRKQGLEQLVDAYQQCSPVSDCVDAISKGVVAGGLVVVPNDGVDPKAAEPPAVMELRQLMRFTNPKQDMVQVVRGVATDLLVTGDGYLERINILAKPIALFSLDATTMSIGADPHGAVTGYHQSLGPKQEADFKPQDVIHFSLDSPKGGLYGTSPTLKLLMPITTWLWASTCLMESMKKGAPPRLHIDHPHGTSDKDIQIQKEQYITTNLGPKNIGTPLTSKGGATAINLEPNKSLEFLQVQMRMRDIIVSGFQAPPQKVSIVESGNLGGGTGEAQDKTWRIDVILPLQSLILEKLNYEIVQQGFGITTHHLEFDEIDMRDSKVVDDIRTQRVDNGVYSVNRARAEVGEPPVPGGDDAFIKTRTGVVFVKDLARYTQAEMDQMEASMVTAQAAQTNAEKPTPAPMAPIQAQDPADRPGGPKDAAQGKAPKERGPEDELHALTESYKKAYQLQRKKALKELPQVQDNKLDKIASAIDELAAKPQTMPSITVQQPDIHMPDVVVQPADVHVEIKPEGKKHRKTTFIKDANGEVIGKDEVED